MRTISPFFPLRYQLSFLASGLLKIPYIPGAFRFSVPIALLAYWRLFQAYSSFTVKFLRDCASCPAMFKALVTFSGKFSTYKRFGDHAISSKTFAALAWDASSAFHLVLAAMRTRLLCG